MDPNGSSEGEQVAIVGGLYKQHHLGTFLHPYGTKMATVLVDRRERNICLSSIAKVPSSTDDEITISRSAEYESLQQDVATLTMQLKKLELKIIQMDKK